MTARLNVRTCVPRVDQNGIYVVSTTARPYPPPMERNQGSISDSIRSYGAPSQMLGY